MKPRIPTLLLTGFLGAGKTTLLNRLIDRYRNTKTVLLINEFGKVSIDAEMMAPGNYEKIELNRGSLFCICVRTDFIAEVERIATQLQPELLIIEATGLADTTEMEKMLALPTIKDKIKLNLCVCLVDCTTYPKIKNILNAPTSQIKSADLVLINKTDLVSKQVVMEVEESVRSLSRDVQIIRTTYADFPLNILDETVHPDYNIEDLPEDGYPDPVLSATISREGYFTTASWNQFLRRLGDDLLRLKGFITLDGEMYHIDMTMDQINMAPTQKISLGENRIVVIGRHAKQETVELALEGLI